LSAESFVTAVALPAAVHSNWAGGPFVFSLAGAPIDAAQKRAEGLREQLRLLPVQHAGQLLGSITVSIGVAAFPTYSSNAETLLKAADEALYRAKRGGRNRVSR
jgi:diguanylate cyclase (GGDEF)-like protein